MVGGTAPDGKPVRDVECFNLDDQTWTTVFRLPKGRLSNIMRNVHHIRLHKFNYLNLNVVMYSCIGFILLN